MQLSAISPLQSLQSEFHIEEWKKSPLEHFWLIRALWVAGENEMRWEITSWHQYWVHVGVGVLCMFGVRRSLTQRYVWMRLYKQRVSQPPRSGVSPTSDVCQPSVSLYNLAWHWPICCPEILMCRIMRGGGGCLSIMSQAAITMFCQC